MERTAPAAKKTKGKKINDLLTTIKELAPNVTIEKTEPIFYNIKKLVTPPQVIYRMDFRGYRYYYRFENGEPVFYTSVTTVIKNTLPTSPHLISWLVSKGEDEGKDIADERAHYGTFLHQEFGVLLMTGKYDLDKLSKRLQDYAIKEKIIIKPDWEGELKRDMMALAQFMIDKKVIPLAIEVILWHPTDLYAGALDLVCEMDYEEKGFFGETYSSGVRKGEQKESKRLVRIPAIIDLKSGRKGFYESHQIQLGAYREMWQIHYPNMPIKHLFNVSPKDWRTTPSYNLTEQSEAKAIGKLPYLTALNKLTESNKNTTSTILSGIIGVRNDLSSNIKEKTLVELVKGEPAE